MSYLYTGSTVESNISTGLSTQILIKVGDATVGAIQSFKPSQDRGIKPVSEIGTDGFIEKVPNTPTNVTISVTRVVFDRKSITAAFSRQFVNIAAQRFPFDVVVFDRSNVAEDFKNPVDGEALANTTTGLIVHEYKNCWFKRISTSYSSGDYIISEDADIECEYVQSHQGAGTTTSVITGETPPNALDDNIEALADVGRRGSLDAVGLGRLLAIT